MSNDELGNVVWVNKLFRDVTENNIRERFAQYGDITNVFMCSSRNRNTTYCFVEYQDESSAQKALSEAGSVWNELEIEVALAERRLFTRSIRRNEARDKLNQRIVEKIEGMNPLEAYFCGFSEGKKYMLRRVTQSAPRRNIRYNRSNRTNDDDSVEHQQA